MQDDASALIYSTGTDISTVDASFPGEDREERLGESVTVLGDINGDGLDDFAFAGSKFSGTGGDVGSVWIYFGNKTGWARNSPHSSADASLNGGAGFDIQDLEVSGAGDVNGDGFDDILVGQPLSSQNGDRSGTVWLHFGKATGWRTGHKLWDANASFLGEGPVNLAGYYLSEAGDVNGDGYDDFLIGAYGNSNETYFSGKCYLIFGKASGWEQDVVLSSANASFYGERAMVYLGKVAAAGDVNGDNYDDFLLGAWRDMEYGAISGQTYLFLGKPDGWQINTSVTNADASFYGEQSGDMSGRAIDGAGDVNGDGLDDIIIGAQYNDEIDGASGKVYIFFGIRNGWAMDTNLSDANVTLLGEDSNEEAGRCVAGVGDINGDGYDDVMVGAPRYGAVAGTPGRAFLILGRGTGWSKGMMLTDASASFIGEGGNAMTGESIDGGGDINGDGYDDLVVGAPGVITMTLTEGKVYLIFPDANIQLTSVSSVTLYSDDVHTKEISSAYMNATIYVRVTGTGGSASRADVTMVRVDSDATSPMGFRLRLFETGDDTGIFEGSFNLMTRSHKGYEWIGTSLGEKVTVTSIVDPSKWDSLMVTARPVLSESPSQFNVTEDVPFTYTFTLSGGIASSWDVVIGAPWLEWNVSNLSLWGTPTNLDVGSGWVSVNVSDDYGNGDEVNVTINVANTPPEIIGEPPTTATEDVPWPFDFNSTDDGQGEITWHIATDASWLIFNYSTGELVGYPFNEDVGTWWVNVSVDDGNGGWDSLNFTVEVLNVADIPVIVTEVLPNATEDVPYSFTLVLADPDMTDIFTWTLESDIPWLDIDGTTGVLFGTPSNDDVGEHWVDVRVTDSYDLCATAHLKLLVLNVNDAPSIITGDLTSILEDVEYRVVYEATDPDVGAVLTWSLETDAGWLSFDDSTGVLSGTPTNDDIGTHLVTVTVSDGEGGTASHAFTLDVIGVNDPPEIVSDLPPLIEVLEDETYTIDLMGEDEEGDDLIWSDDTDLFDISPTDGTISFLPTQSEVGEWWVNITAEDSEGLTDVVLIRFAVLNVNDEPIILSLSPENGSKYKEGKMVPFAVEATDEDGDDLTVTWTSDGVTIGSGDTLEYKKLKPGTRTIKVTVSDGEASVEEEFTLVIKKEEESPALGGVFVLLAMLVGVAASMMRRKG